MSTYRTFEELPIWKKARSLVKEVYRLTQQDRLSKDFGLRDQLQRAGISVMTNIAEGFERRTKKEFIRFLFIAKGSTGEVRSLATAAFDLAYIDEKSFKDLSTI